MTDDYQIKNALWAVAFFALIIPNVILRGVAIKLLWLWFMVPFGLPAIGFAWAMGLGAFVVFTAGTARVDFRRQTDEISMKKVVNHMIFNPLAVVGLGFIFSFFV